MDARSEYEAAMAVRTQGEVITAHRRALLGLTAAQRAVLLDAVRTHLLTGTRHTSDDVDALARFVACAEMRRPGSLLGRVTPDLAHRLRGFVVTALPVLPSRIRERHDVGEPETPARRKGSGWDGLANDPAYQNLVASHMMLCVTGTGDVLRGHRTAWLG